MEDQDIIGMNDTAYKRYHESLMENNHGSSALHVFFCILFTVQCSIYSSVRIKGFFRQEIYEYLVIVLPLILAHTVLSDYLYLLNIIIFAALMCEIKTYIHLKYDRKITKLKSCHTKIQLITVLRGLTYLISVFCILAVDFKSFPRELAKTERYGYSLMDTGVGLFMMMSGIVHKDLSKNPRNYLLKDSEHWRNVVLGHIKMFAVLAALGIARYVSIKHLDYQEHVSEYGVHWNFFFTMAVCKILSTLMLYFASKSNSSTGIICLNFTILIIHELILFYGVQEWVFGDSPRDSILSANREGLSSCLGYVAMYIFGSLLKEELTNKNYYIIQLNYKGKSINTGLVKLVIGSIILWGLTFITNYYRPASRTLANAAFCIFIESIMITIVTILYFFEKYFFNEMGNFVAPKIIDEVNSNGLLYFLIANLLTGAFNLSMRTLLVSSANTFVLLNMYMILTLILPKCLKGLKIFLYRLIIRRNINHIVKFCFICYIWGHLIQYIISNYRNNCGDVDNNSSLF